MSIKVKSKTITNSDSEDETYDRTLSYDEVEFTISVGELESCLHYSIYGLTEQKLSKFINAQKNNQEYSLTFKPGSNQSADIVTGGGNTVFSVDGAGGDNPVNFSISVPNKYCLDAFNNLLL